MSEPQPGFNSPQAAFSQSNFVQTLPWPRKPVGGKAKGSPKLTRGISKGVGRGKGKKAR